MTITEFINQVLDPPDVSEFNTTYIEQRYAPFTFLPLFVQWGKKRLCVLAVGYHCAGDMHRR